MATFQYEPVFQHEADHTEYRLLTRDHVREIDLGGERFLEVDPEALTLLADEAMRDLAHLLRTSHLEKLASILSDPEASTNDRVIARELLMNAVIAAEGVFPSCQDTGTATVVGKRGDHVLVRGDEAEALCRGIWKRYQEGNLRYSQVAPLTMYEERNTGNNLPAQIDLLATRGSEYRFLFVAKGGGSANKSMLFQETKALLRPDVLREFLWQKIHKIGTAACPPYHLAIVVGGLSAEMTAKTVKLASAGSLDGLPASGNAMGRAFRDTQLEAEVLEMTRRSGIGAQFGGRCFCHDVRVIRLPRHGASCPVGIGVSCSADRNVLARIDRDGIWLERLETEPARFLPPSGHGHGRGAGPRPVTLDLARPMDAIRAQLSSMKVGDVVHMSGPVVVARDIAHAKLMERFERTGDLPQYLKDHPVYYAGPAKTPPGFASGSFGPTTAERMDPYVDAFQAAGASMVMLAKGNRTPQVTQACAKHGGFYLGSIGGPAARLGRDCIRKVEVIDFPDLGMEAVYRIEVQDFAAFIVVDDKGNDFYARFRDPEPLVGIGKRG